MGRRKGNVRSSSGRSDIAPAGHAVAGDVTGSETGHASGGPTDGPGGRKKRRWLRRLFWACAVLIAVILVLRIALWLSLPWILNKTMDQYGLEARYERLHLSLLTGDAELWHLVLVPDDANTPLVHVEYCRADVSLVTLLKRRLVVHRIEIDGMDVSLMRAKDGSFPQLRTLLAVLRERSEAIQRADADVEVDVVPTRKPIR